MEVVELPEQWRQHLRKARAAEMRVGVIPTMGALHRGHLSLIDAVRNAGANFTTVSLFVNPTQFDNADDLSNYPRTLDADLRACEDAGVNLVFTPTAKSMRQLPETTRICPSELASRLEGAHRPGHFEGMATVVTKLLQLAGPCLAAFGQKDYQQLAIVRELVRDMLLEAEIIACPIVRDADGLALSSRNVRLSSTARKHACAIYAALREAYDQFHESERDAAALTHAISERLRPHVDSIDYVAIVERQTLTPVEVILPSNSAILIAAYVDGVRLIDNIEV